MTKIGELITIEQLAERLAMDEDRLRGWVKERRIPSIRPWRGALWFDPREVFAALKRSSDLRQATQEARKSGSPESA